MKQKYLTANSFQTKKLGKILAKEILKAGLSKKAKVLGLIGDLGGGKTTFLQGFAKGLGIKNKILSPTFVILKKFQVSGFNFHYFFHIDCYRIQKEKELLDLRFKEIIQDPKNIIAIEWADRIRKILPKNTLILKFKFINKNKRKIVVE